MLSNPINVLSTCYRTRKLTQETTLLLALYSKVYENKRMKEKLLGLPKGVSIESYRKKEDQTLDFGPLQLQEEDVVEDLETEI